MPRAAFTANSDARIEVTPNASAVEHSASTQASSMVTFGNRARAAATASGSAVASNVSRSAT